MGAITQRHLGCPTVAAIDWCFRAPEPLIGKKDIFDCFSGSAATRYGCYRDPRIRPRLRNGVVKRPKFVSNVGGGGKCFAFSRMTKPSRPSQMEKILNAIGCAFGGNLGVLFSVKTFKFLRSKCNCDDLAEKNESC